MRLPVMTIYDENDIEVTASIENNSEEFLSKKTVTGIVLYVEQWSKEYNDFAAMSLLIKKGELELLKNYLFTHEEEKYIVSHLGSITKEISDYVKEEMTNA